MDPMTRSSEVDAFLDWISKGMFGRSRTEAIKSNICIFCGKDSALFRDEISITKYKITGLCQKCQDDTDEDDNEAEI
jgi:hypothetical protein